MSAENEKPAPVRLRIDRRDGPSGALRVEDFEIAWRAGMTYADALQAIAAEPRTSSGTETTAVAWAGRCEGAVCGACTALVDGRARPLCTTPLAAPTAENRAVRLAPFEKFPVLRDLLVDRSRVLADLVRMGVSLPLEAGQSGDDPLGLDRCTNCSACLEACPEYAADRPFVGALVLARVLRSAEAPREGGPPGELLDRVMGQGGLADCGKFENCTEVCPAGIPLFTAIQRLSRATTKYLLSELGRRLP